MFLKRLSTYVREEQTEAEGRRRERRVWRRGWVGVGEEQRRVLGGAVASRR